MNREESGGGPDQRRRTISLPAAILAGSLAVPIVCFGIPFVLAIELKDRFFISRSEMQRRITEQAALLQAQHAEEIKKVICCLENEIIIENKAEEVNLQLKTENAALKTVEIILEAKLAEFKEAFLHEKVLNDRIQKSAILLNKDLDEARNASNEASSLLLKVEAEKNSIKASQSALIKEVGLLQQRNKYLKEYAEKASQLLSRIQTENKAALCKKQKEVYAWQEREQVERHLKVDKIEELRIVNNDYDQFRKLALEAASHLDELVDEKKEKDEELRKLRAELRNTQHEHKQAAEVVSRLQNESKIYKEAKEEELRQMNQELREAHMCSSQFEKELNFLKKKKEEEANNLCKELEKALEASRESTELARQLKNANKILQEEREEEVRNIKKELEKALNENKEVAIANSDLKEILEQRNNFIEKCHNTQFKLRKKIAHFEYLLLGVGGFKEDEEEEEAISRAGSNKAKHHGEEAISRAESNKAKHHGEEEEEEEFVRKEDVIATEGQEITKPVRSNKIIPTGWVLYPISEQMEENMEKAEDNNGKIGKDILERSKVQRPKCRSKW